MRSNTGVPCSANQGLSRFLLNVLIRLKVFESLGQTEVDQINDVFSLATASHKVIWFYVSMDETLHMEKLNPRNDLICQHKHCLSIERTRAI